MRYLLDLQTKIVIITYTERYFFPQDKESRYRNLCFYMRGRTAEEEAQVEELGNIEGEKGINIDSVTITNVLPAKKKDVLTVLNGYELTQINAAIEKLREPYKGQKILLKDVDFSNDY